MSRRRGRFSRKPALAVKSFLATQNPAACEVWLWLDGDTGVEDPARNPHLQPLLPCLTLRRFEAEVEMRGTPYEVEGKRHIEVRRASVRKVPGVQNMNSPAKLLSRALARSLASPSA